MKAQPGAADLHGVYVGETWGEVEMVPVPAESLCPGGQNPLPRPCALEGAGGFYLRHSQGSFMLFKQDFLLRVFCV